MFISKTKDVAEQAQAEAKKDGEQIRLNNSKVIELFNNGNQAFQENKNQCTKCGKRHKSINECSHHLQQYKCELCDRKFKQEKNLLVHQIQEHVDCNNCNKVMKNESGELQMHRQIC